MARGEIGQQQVRARNRAVVQHRAGRVRVVAPVDGVVGAVGIAAPDPLGIAEIAVDVFPAVVNDPAVGQQRGVALVQRAVADLLHVGAVGLHREQVAHDVPVAHAVLGLAGRREQDAAVGQVDRVDVGQAGSERDLPQLGAIRVHFVNVVVVLAIAAHRKQDLRAVEADVGVAGHAVRHFQQRLHLAGCQVDRLQRPAALKAAGVDLAGLEHGLRIMVVLAVLAADDEQQRPAADQGVGRQRLAPQGDELRRQPSDLFPGSLFQCGDQPLEPGDVLAALGFAIRKQGHPVLDRGL